MSNAKEASEAEALGMKVLNLCRKKASEKDLLTVLEVRFDAILNSPSLSLSRERIQIMCLFLFSLCNVFVVVGLTTIKLVLVSFVLFVLFESVLHRSRSTKRRIIISVL